MAQSFESDHPNYLARHSVTQIVLPTVSGTRGHFIPAQAVDMSKVTLTIVTPGTSATGLVLIPTMGGTAIGTYAAGTAVAGSQQSYTPAAPLPVAALGVTNYVVTGTDATGVFAVTWEYRASGTGSVTF